MGRFRGRHRQQRDGLLMAKRGEVESTWSLVTSDPPPPPAIKHAIKVPHRLFSHPGVQLCLAGCC